MLSETATLFPSFPPLDVPRAPTGLVREHVPLSHPARDRGEDPKVRRLGKGEGG